MKCTECGNELKVVGYKNVISGADSPETQTELRCVQTLVCANTQCAKHGHALILSHALNFEEE